jgi:hypothetical protein
LTNGLHHQVFESDGMPRKICECCKTILGNSYKFKQICKRSDTLLKMYPITGNVPPKIKIPQEMLPPRSTAQAPSPQKPKTKSVGVNCDDVEPQRPEMYEIGTQTDEYEGVEMMVIDEENYEAVIAPPEQFITEPPKRKLKVESMKILNKATSQAASPAKQFRKPSQVKIERVEVMKPKILNSQLQTQVYETVGVDNLDAAGNIKILTFSEEDGEYLEEAEFVKSDEPAEEGIVYTCGVCERSFPLLQQLELHKVNHTRERNHPCDMCEKSFFTKYDLAKHVLTHTKQKDYQCIVCEKSFSRSTLLYRHEKIHNDPNLTRHQCADCDRTYLNILDYEKHVKTHEKNRPYQCSYCDKAFAFKQGLERHEVIHDVKSLPNPCQYCDMRFPSAARLQRHLSQKHAGMRPFPCSKCPKRFSMSHHLYRHMRTAHPDTGENTTLQCPECEEIYNNRDTFFHHALEHANMTMTCPMCKLVFETADDAAEHVEKHSTSDMHFCDYCNLIYMTAEDLQAHFMEMHSEELCAVGEEIEFIVEEPEMKKRKIAPKVKSPAKKKVEEDVEYEINEGYEEDYSDQYIVNDMEGAAFVEYEEIAEEEFEPVKPPVKAVPVPVRPQRVYSRIREEKVVEKKPKQLPTKNQAPTVRKTRAEIEQLKKDGKIEILPNGEMRMKQQ